MIIGYCILVTLSFVYFNSGKTCSEIKLYSPQATSGSYVIDPDGDGGYPPFTVYCDMTDKNGVGVSVVSHDSESRTLINDYGASGSYARNVHYIGAGITSVPQVAFWISLHTASSLSNTNAMVLPSSIWVAPMAGGYHVT